MMSSSSLPSRYLSTRHAAGLYASWLMSFLTLPSYAYSIIQQELLIRTAFACMMGALWNECMNLRFQESACCMLMEAQHMTGSV